MNRHKLLLRLYPRVWRVRYEEELLALLESRPLSFADSIDMLRGALDTHLHPYLGTTGMAFRERIRSMLYTLRRSVITVFCAYIGFVVAGLAFQKMTEYDDFVAVANTHRVVGTSFTLIEIGSIVALLAILIGGLPIAFTVVQYALATKRLSLCLLLAVPFIALAVLVGTIQIVGHTFAGQLPEVVGRTIFVGSFLAAAVISTVSVCAAVARSNITSSLLRFAILPSTVATVAMGLMLLGTIFWGLSLQSEAPRLFGGNDGIMGSSTVGTWLGIIVTMALSTGVAAISLLRGISVRSRFSASS